MTAVSLRSICSSLIRTVRMARSLSDRSGGSARGLELEPGVVYFREIGANKATCAAPECIMKYSTVYMISAIHQHVDKHIIPPHASDPMNGRQSADGGLEKRLLMLSQLEGNSAIKSVLDKPFDTWEQFSGFSYDNLDPTVYTRYLTYGQLATSEELAGSLHELLSSTGLLRYDRIRICPKGRHTIQTIGCTKEEISTPEERCIEFMPLEAQPEYHPGMMDREHVAVYHDFGRTMSFLNMCSDVFPEVKKVLDISKKYLTGDSARPEILRSRMKHPFIVVEGIDATGKSTLIEGLGEYIGASQLKSPPPYISHIRSEFDRHPELTRRAYYCLGNYMMTNEVADKCQTTPVVMDRFWHSTAAYAIAQNCGFGDVKILPPKGHWVYQWPSDMIKPDAVIFLTVSEGERNKRLNQRHGVKTVEEVKLSASEFFRERLKESYRRMDQPCCIEVKADGTREEVIESVVSKLKSLNLLR